MREQGSCPPHLILLLGRPLDWLVQWASCLPGRPATEMEFHIQNWLAQQWPNCLLADRSQRLPILWPQWISPTLYQRTAPVYINCQTGCTLSWTVQEAESGGVL